MAGDQETAQARYQTSQAALRREYEGNRENNGVRISAPTEAVVNPAVYRDVEPILFRGFLTVTAQINEVLFVLKNLNHHEFEYVMLASGLVDRQNLPQRFWDLFLAYGVVMVDGQNVLLDRERWLPKIADMFRELPRTSKLGIIRHISALNRRSSGAAVIVEAYATELYSRYKWAQYKGLDLSSSAVTGWAGTEKLGLNWSQLTWRALNSYLDLKDMSEREWENAKFVGACMAGKGIQKVYNRDNRRRQTEKEESLARKDKVLRYVLFGEPFEGAGTQSQSGVKIVARSAKELAIQLEHDLRGEKDWHDLAVQAHEQKGRHEATERQARLKELMEAVPEDSQRVVEGSAMQGFTMAQVTERVQQRRLVEAKSLAIQGAFPEIVNEDAAKRLRKWSSLSDDTETVIDDTDRDTSNAHSFPTPRPTGAPWRR